MGVSSGLSFFSNMLLSLALSAAVLASVSGLESSVNKVRNPRLFLVSSSSTTSTLTTTTVCFSSTTTLAACAAGKKRAIDNEGLSEEAGSIRASAPLGENEGLESGHLDSERAGKFLLYWMTTTSTSTSTTYSSTSTLASLLCTPSNFAISLCG